jgi:hypothetical protein
VCVCVCVCVYLSLSHENMQVMLTECDKHNAIGRALFWGPDIVRLTSTLSLATHFVIRI